MKNFKHILSQFISLVSADTDGTNEMSKNKNGEVKDCFEKLIELFLVLKALIK